MCHISARDVLRTKLQIGLLSTRTFIYIMKFGGLNAKLMKYKWLLTRSEIPHDEMTFHTSISRPEVRRADPRKTTSRFHYWKLTCNIVSKLSAMDVFLIIYYYHQRLPTLPSWPLAYKKYILYTVFFQHCLSNSSKHVRSLMRQNSFADHHRALKSAEFGFWIEWLFNNK